MSSKSTKPSKKELGVKADSKEEASNDLNMASLLPGERLRAVIIRLHHFQQEDRIVREATAKRGKLQYRGSPIAIYEDYAPEVVEQRTKYREVLAELYNLGLKPVLLFPAKLIITTKDGGKRRLASAEEAKSYLTNVRANVV
ncbi:hypothetical protein MHYP_G00042870 [Metynnis hypsauchen]